MQRYIYIKGKRFEVSHSELIILGIDGKAQEGYPHGCANIGYINRRVGRRAWIEPDPLKKDLVISAWELAASGEYSLRKILEIVTEAGLRSRNGRRLGVSGLWEMLSNPMYAGQFLHDGVLHEGWYEPLISTELYNKVQQELRRKRKVMSS